MNIFQTAILIIFGFILVVGVLIFAGVLPGFRATLGGAGGEVVWWGTWPADQFNPLLLEFNKEHEKEFTLIYVEKDRRTLEAELVEALALGEGPDLVTLPQELIVRQGAKLAPWPEAALSRRTFTDTFIRESDLLLGAQGVLALPLYVDPLVMYYNDDLLSSVRLARPPATWSQLQEAIGRGLVKTDGQGNILQAAVALGQFNNIVHAKDLLVTLIMQAGNDIAVRASSPTGGERWRVVLRDLLGFAAPPAGEAVDFFNRFSDPANALYSWNSALAEAREMFAAGASVFYFGYASELPRLRLQNPQLNFDATVLPQRDGATRHVTFGRLYSVGVLAQSSNRQTAFKVAGLLVSPEFNLRFSQFIGLPPALSDLLAQTPARPDGGAIDPLLAAFYQAAVIARAWPDPNPAASAEILRRLVESAKTGQVPTPDAVNQAHLALEVLFRQ